MRSETEVLITYAKKRAKIHKILPSASSLTTNLPTPVSKLKTVNKSVIKPTIRITTDAYKLTSQSTLKTRSKKRRFKKLSIKELVSNIFQKQKLSQTLNFSRKKHKHSDKQIKTFDL